MKHPPSREAFATIRRLKKRNGSLTRVLQRAIRSSNVFFADVTHELRTPLTIIQGNLDLLYLQNKDLPAELLKPMEIMRAEINKMAKLLKDMTEINFAEIYQEPQHLSLKEPFSLEALLEKIIDDLSPAINERDLILRSRIEARQLYGDYDQLKKAIHNVLENSIINTPRGGLLSIETKPRDDFVEIIIRDSGRGIHKDDIPYFFDRFYQTKSEPRRQRTGSGLSMAIAKMIVEQHGGTIRIQSTPDKGSTFTISLS